MKKLACEVKRQLAHIVDVELVLLRHLLGDLVAHQMSRLLMVGKGNTRRGERGIKSAVLPPKLAGAVRRHEKQRQTPRPSSLYFTHTNKAVTEEVLIQKLRKTTTITACWPHTSNPATRDVVKPPDQKHQHPHDNKYFPPELTATTQEQSHHTQSTEATMKHASWSTSTSTHL